MQLDLEETKITDIFLDMIETKDNFSGTINERKDLNKKIASNSNCDIL
ncbi:hypothetical protein [Borreliella bavariensis]|nr:hypothetical protein [Borreliella bavariensis]